MNSNQNLDSRPKLAHACEFKLKVYSAYDFSPLKACVFF